MLPRQFLKVCLISTIMIFSFGRQAMSAGRVMVCVGRGSTVQPPRDMSLYSVEARCFAQEMGLAGFPEALREANLLFINQKSRYALEAAIKGENGRAIRAFLARGGVMWIDRASDGGPRITDFMKTLGVEAPPQRIGGYGVYVTNPKSKNTILSTPKSQIGEVRGHQYWTTWPKSLEPLLVGREDPRRAAMLLASGVQGKGLIFFTTAGDGWSERLDALVENVLVRAFGPLPAPGETHPVFDPYQLRKPLANTAHLIKAGHVEWHVANAPRRSIFLISEPVGMSRRNAYVELACRSNGETLRAFTAAGVELPAQALGGGRVAVSVPLRKYDDLAVYVYAGGKTAGRTQSIGPFSLQQTPEGWLMRNDLFEAITARARPSLLRIRPYGSTKNMLCTWGDPERWLGNGTDFAWDHSGAKTGPARITAAVVADGPVVKILRYTMQMDKGRRVVDISLVRGATALFYRLRSDTPQRMLTETGWQPGPSHTDDTYWYEADDGLKRLPIVRKPGSRHAYGKHHKEPWYAIVDEKANEVGGGFSQRPRGGAFPVTYFCHLLHGHLISQWHSFDVKGTRGGWVAAKGDAHAVRSAYIAWRHPPVVTVGVRQAQKDAPAPRRPVFGRDFIRLLGGFRRYYPRNTRLGLDAWADSAVSTMKVMAGNYAQMGDHVRMADFPPFIRTMHAHGVGASLKINTRRMGCTIKNREKYLQATRVQARYGGDLYYLLDEFAHQDNCEVCQADFKRRTGLDLPRNLDTSKLPDETTYQAILWRMNTLTGLVRQMTAIVKEHHPDARTFIVTSPKQMSSIVTSHNDQETWSGIIDSTSSDLYSTDFSKVRFALQYIRGAQGNSRPILTVHGATFTPEALYVNLAPHLMHGGNALWFFSTWWQRHGRNVQQPVLREYELLRDSGYEDLLARAHPVRYAAVLCERNSFFDSIRRGQLNGRRALYHVYVEKQAALRNVPMDIVFASHLETDLPNYRVLVVPSGRGMSDRSAKAVAAWVHRGGKVIVEGEALLTPALAALCGVDAQDAPRDLRKDVEGTGGTLKGLTLSAGTRAMPLVARGARVLATAGGGAVVTTRRAGKGTAVALALINVPHDLLHPLVLDLGGRLPLEADAASNPDVRVTALTDGTRTAIGVFNEHFSDPRTVRIALGDIAPRRRRVATNVHTGTRRQVTDTLTMTLAGKRWNFILLEDSGSAPPLAAPGGFVNANAYARWPGMTFLKLARIFHTPFWGGRGAARRG